jgi:hypothetical protein
VGILLYKGFANVLSVKLAAVPSHFMHLVNTLLGVILSSNEIISAVLVLFRVNLGLCAALKDENRPTLGEILFEYFAHVSSVGLITVSGNIILLANTLWGQFELGKFNIGSFGNFGVLLLGL